MGTNPPNFPQVFCQGRALPMNTEERIDYYLNFVTKYPHVFANDPNPNSIRIVTDRKEILRRQHEFHSIAKSKLEPPAWYDLGIVAEDNWVLVIRDLVVFPGGKYGCYIRMLNKASALSKTGDDVVIIVLLEDKILLLRHFRHDDRKWHWEAPRGFGEPGLSPSENAKKEIAEELGMEARELIRIGGGSSDGSEKASYFIAKCSGETRLEKEEGIDEWILVSPTEMSAMILDGRINDRHTMKAFLYLKLQELL